jgi:hypothetical protein
MTPAPSDTTELLHIMSTSWVLEEGIRILILLIAAGIVWFGPIVYFIPIRLYLDQKAAAQRSVTRVQEIPNQKFAGRKSSSSKGQRILAKQNRYKTYHNRFRDWCFPVDLTDRDNKIKQLYVLVLEPTHSIPKPDFFVHPDSIPQEQSDFLRYNNHITSTYGDYN